MIEFISAWYRRHFSNPQVVLLALLLILGFAVVLLAGQVLAPLLAAIVIAYLLDGAVVWLEGLGLRRTLATTLVFLVFVGAVLAVMVWLMPLLFRQAAQFFSEVPNMATRGQQLLMQLPERYPAVFEELRGTGLMLGLKCAMPNTDVLAKARAQGLLLAPGGDNVVRLLPPLTIGEEEISAACKALETAAEELSS